MPRSSKRLARRNRRSRDGSLTVLPAGVTLTGAAVSTPTNTALATFSGVLNVSGAGSKITVGGLAVTGLTQVSPTVIRITKSDAAATLAGQTYIIPQAEPGLRTPAGGFVTPKTGTF